MDEAAKKTLLRKVPHGLYVVTSGAGEKAHGFTATWLTQASFQPPIVVLGVRRDSQSYTSITGAGTLCVNLVPKDRRDLAEKFFKPPAAGGGRFGDLSFHAGPATGSPVLDDALGFLECRVLQVVDRGDHSAVVAEVVEAGVLRDGELLVLSDTPWKYGG
jgi:flavin reductase (DIM6/NTAB) family NADH-FMN oxidoreductase RutF